jgi:DEAD/DEAH box helicase domain-containing protein
MIETIAEQVGIRVADRIELPSRQAILVPPPTELHDDVRAYLTSHPKYQRGLYSHQGKAISAVLAGQDVCLSTSTASGKSLVFMSVAADLLKRERHARVLAFYPVRALIQDQLEKWKAMLDPLGFSVGFIDGSVETKQRSEILLRHRVVLMTPDVAHAWFMSSLGDERVALVRKNLALLVLDEAHVYDGVFGTNMAFFLRRLQAVCAPCRLICSTATLGEPNDFISQLTGRQTLEFGTDQEGAQIPNKTVWVARFDGKKGFEVSAQLLKALARQHQQRFLAFADSRKMVELMTAAAHRADKPTEAGVEEALDELADETANHLVPYRAGYESEDRLRIQQSLSEGKLRGVVSTSALELGLDIGEVNLVVLLTTPPSLKAFWQRIGRAGRREAGEALVLDTVGTIVGGSDGLRGYVKRPIEPNWLYLPNRYIQYTDALCAAQERQDAGDLYDAACFQSLPSSFRQFVEQEINPTQMLPSDLFALKQRAAGAGPHQEFPLRSGVEKSFKVESQQRPLGNLTFSQLLREAYPGAVYYYMARPFRILSVSHSAGQVLAQPCPRYTTQPLTQVMVFPDLISGLHRLLVGSGGFVAEAEMQVAERVTGFKEKRGPNEATHNYGVGSPHSQRPLQRFIKTTGVCWCFPDPLAMSDAVATRILEATCREFAIQPRDLGLGRFHVQQSPLGTGPLQGVCIFDSTHGSLRLTERLGEHFAKVVQAARQASEMEATGGVPGNSIIALKTFCRFAESLTEQHIGVPAQSPASPVDTPEWIEVIAPNEKAILVSGATEAMEIVVQSYFFTPQGLKYQLQHENPGIRWTVEAGALQSMNGVTRMVLYNPSTGEEKPKP